MLSSLVIGAAGFIRLMPHPLGQIALGAAFGVACAYASAEPVAHSPSTFTNKKCRD